MALQDWKRNKNATHGWNNVKTKDYLEIGRIVGYDKFIYIVKLKHNNSISELFGGSESKALKFAKSYMKKH